VIKTPKDVQMWRSQWMQELKSWHSPYKLVLDCNQLTVESSPEVEDALKLMLKFFEGLFLKSAVGFTTSPEALHGMLPFDLVTTFEEAQTKAGVRGMRGPAAPGDFRAMIQFQNHFPQHVIEVSFSDAVLIDSNDKIATFKSKLTNNLMQWHSKWNLLVDCTNLSFSPEVFAEWSKMEKYFSSFFMKTCVGYGPSAEKANYPFTVYRARHKAVATLEAEGLFMGNDAQCNSRKAK